MHTHFTDFVRVFQNGTLRASNATFQLLWVPWVRTCNSGRHYYKVSESHSENGPFCSPCEEMQTLPTWGWVLSTYAKMRDSSFQSLMLDLYMWVGNTWTIRVRVICLGSICEAETLWLSVNQHLGSLRKVGTLDSQEHVQVLGFPVWWWTSFLPNGIHVFCKSWGGLPHFSRLKL